MRIYHNKLSQTLNGTVKPVWLVFGDEPWQKIDSLATIKQHALQHGFTETVRLSADDKFDWASLVEEFQAMSLFASQRIIELELPTGKVGIEGSKTLINISEHLPPDILLIVHGPKLDASASKKKWFTQLEKAGCYLPLYDIDAEHLPRWVQQQARQKSVQLSTDVVSFLTEFFIGNLPALSQELDKLALLYPQQKIELTDVEEITINQAKFNPFQLTDALLLGNLEQCSAMLESLQAEGTNAGQIIWILHKELSQLTDMLFQLSNGSANIQTLFKTFRIWNTRQPIYQKALTTITLENAHLAISRLNETDLISKTSSDFNAFILLLDVCLTLHHGNITKMLPLNYEYN